jgi:dTDP-4-amino-4,6-dideoxygalactose transaminase
MAVPLLDLRKQYERIQKELEAAVLDVCRSGQYILGPAVEQFEQECAAYCGAGAALGVSSGSDALLMALTDAGVGPGDEVVTTPFTFFATVGAIARLGAKPVFVDIEPEGFNLDQDQALTALTPRTKAVILVHLFGRWCQFDRLLTACEARGIVVIEDAAQAIGCEDAAGRRAGSVGHYGAFSFFPSKNLGACGDGGLLTVRDQKTAERVKLLRNHGMNPPYIHHVVGGNFRLDALQAAVLSVKLKYLEGWHAGRRANAERYADAFAEAGVPRDRVQMPAPGPGRHIYNQYTIRCADRDGLMNHLRQQGIGCAVYYPICMHEQPCFAYLNHRRGDFPLSEEAARTVLSLPVYPELTAAQQLEVARAIAAYYRRG